MELAVINDKTIALSELDPAYLDRGTFFGDGVYEVIRSYNGSIFALEEHLERFSRSLKAIEIENVDISGIRKKVQKGFEQAEIPNAKIYFHITRGSGERDHVTNYDPKPNFFMTISALPDSSEIKEKGIAAISYPDMRWKRCDIKSLNLLPNVLAKRQANRQNAQEAILVDEKGFITEGSASAFFAVFCETLQTSALGENILPSITRTYIIKAAMNLNIEIQEKSISAEKIHQADELFIAVTTKDIIPVVKFDNHIIADGKAGKALINEFKKFIQH